MAVIEANVKVNDEKDYALWYAVVVYSYTGVIIKDVEKLDVYIHIMARRVLIYLLFSLQHGTSAYDTHQANRYHEGNAH